jgi:2-isopropylmalate synthase
MVLATRRDKLPYTTGLDTKQLYPASQLLTQIIGVGVQPNKAIVGANAFAHEAGIHQDGFLKERTTYEIIDPKTVGVPESKLVLGKHSGRHALKARCSELGLEISREELDALYVRFTELADNKKGITDEEIRKLAGEVLAAGPARRSA